MKTQLPIAFTLLTGAAFGQFGLQELLVPSGSAYDIDQLDVDMDGDLDFVIAVATPGLVATVENLGDGTFGVQQPIGMAGDLPGCIIARVVDVDGDGMSDVVAASTSQDTVLWYRFLGPGSFGPAQIISTTVDTLEDIEFGDFDGDGDVDLLSSASTPDSIYFHENMGASGFAAEVAVTTAVNAPQGITTGDIDGDGVLDLVTSSFADNKIAWYTGMGDGTFGMQRLITTGAVGARDVQVADLDDDGLLDVVYTSSVDSRVRWSRNTGGLFASPVTIATSCGGLSRVVVDDVDDDGDLDVVVSCPVVARVRVIENLGFGFFGAPLALDGSKSFPRFVKLMDVDGDLDRDVVSTDTTTTVGFVVNRQTRELGTTYCTSTPNSSGVVGKLAATGSGFANLNQIALTATDLSVASFGYFLTSRNQGMVNQPAGSQGVLCLGANIGRYVGPGQIKFSGLFREMRLVIDLTQVPQPTQFVSVAAGETWNYQLWHRDTVSGQSTSNFTDAVSLTFQ